MTFVASAGTYLATWIGRANQAWGTSRQWNVGSSFETDLANMTASRDYWQHTVAHNDPNVWTNRYNAGVAAAWAVANNPDAWYTGSGAWDTGNQGDNQVFVFPRTGHYSVFVIVEFSGYFDHGAGNQTLRVGGSGGCSSNRDFGINTNSAGCTVQFTSTFHQLCNGGGNLTVATPQWAAHGNYNVSVVAHFVSDATYHN